MKKKIGVLATVLALAIAGSAQAQGPGDTITPTGDRAYGTGDVPVPSAPGNYKGDVGVGDRGFVINTTRSWTRTHRAVRIARLMRA